MSGHTHPHEHPHPHDHAHPHEHVHPHGPRPSGLSRRALLGAGGLGIGAFLLAACAADPTEIVATPGSTSSPLPSEPAVAGLSGFDEFASTVRTFVSGDYWMVESNGLPSHNMMVGITSWQQQFPFPQPFSGDNAFRLPASPSLAQTPVSARTGLFSGAIALAVNGVPIFNALNNRGDDALLSGELDEWGGHCGRADDYHYHVAPLHLESTVGYAKPIAYALDGYAIYGTLEPDGSARQPLDEYNGHPDDDAGYHYHGTSTYPYINGGLVGEVTVRNDAIDPQPRTTPVRPAGEPLAGAVITDFETVEPGSYRLTFELEGQTSVIAYTVTDTTVTFDYTDALGNSGTETFTR